VFDLASWIAQSAIVLLAVGFPIALLIAWTIESKPHQVVASAVRSKPTIVDWTLCCALALVIVLIGYQRTVPASDTARQAGVNAARSASLSPAGVISVAVLPFTNLSSDPEQEFFSDGITEEITAALAKVPDLRVVARTSAFEFKGQNRNIQTIGQQLQATHLIEGSVRKAGDRVRITAQLINAANGTHIWSENYDRQLTDIFVIQEDIARTVTASLNMSLGLNRDENLVNNRSIDSDSYEKFLRAKALNQGRGGVTALQEIQNITVAASLLEDVIGKNPGYAPAWAILAGAYGVLANRHAINPNIAEARALTAELSTKGEAAARKAIQLDGGSAQGHAVLGWLMRSRGNLIEADQLLRRSLQLDPLASGVLFLNGMLSAGAGRLEEALDFYEKGQAVDPFPNLSLATARFRWLNGQHDSAIALAKTLRAADRAPMLALIYASMGRYGEAADALMEAAAGESNSDLARAARLLRLLPAKPVSREELPQLLAGLNILYIYLGASERALQAYQRAAEVGYINGDRGAVWHPAYAPVRRTAQFKALMRKVGYVDYWRAKGWPSFCRPVGADDFACE
jgi:adenylate cyclase